jgi:polar amino acid transport system substrate-binding protein
MRQIRLFCAGLAISAALFITPCVAQQGPPDIEAITTRGYLVVAMTAFDNAPFYSVRDGHLEGIDVSLSEDIARALGVDVVYDRSSPSFNDVVGKVRNSEADIAVSKISRTNTRARVVAFSVPYVRLRNALMFNRLKLAQKSKGRDLGDYIRTFDGTLGVIEKSSFATFATQRFPNAKLIAYKDWGEVVEATIAGEVDAAYRDEFEVRRIAFDRPETAINLRTVTIADDRDAISVVVSWNAPMLLAMVNQVIDGRISELTADDVIEMYRSTIEAKEGH